MLAISLEPLLLLLSHFSRVRLLATPWTAAHQAPPSLGFSRQEDWRGVPSPSPLWSPNRGNSLPQLRLQLWEAYCQVRYLCSHLRGSDSADSAVSTDSSMDESSETSSAKDVPAGSLRTALNELKRLIQSIVDGMEPTVRGRTECSGLRRAWRLKLSPEGEVSPGTRNLIKSARMPSEPLSELTSHRGAGTGTDQPPESLPAGSG